MFKLVEGALPWITSQLGVCHGTNRLLVIVGQAPAVYAILKKALEVIDWFSM